MNLTDDVVLKFQKGSPVLLDDVCAIYPATLGEIVDEGYSKFQQYLTLLTSTKPDGKNNHDTEMAKLLTELTDFQYILLIASIDENIREILIQAFNFFIHEKVTFSLDPPQIIIGESESQRLVTEKNFYDFQQILRRMYFLEVEGEEIVINPTDSPAVIQLKKQMQANREKVRKAKAKEAARKHNDLKFSDLIGSITINNCGLNMKNIWNITYYAFHDQLKRMGWRDQFNINNQAAMAGAKLKKEQLKHWMRSIANSEQS